MGVAQLGDRALRRALQALKLSARLQGLSNGTHKRVLSTPHLCEPRMPELPRKYTEGKCDIVIREAECTKTMEIWDGPHPTMGAIALGGFGLIVACMGCCGLNAARLRREEARRKKQFKPKFKACAQRRSIAMQSVC